MPFTFPSESAFTFAGIRISEGYLPKIPFILQKSIFALAGFAGRVTGLNRHLAKYLNEA
jgi:hypothetical protein